MSGGDPRPDEPHERSLVLWLREGHHHSIFLHVENPARAPTLYAANEVPTPEETKMKYMLMMNVPRGTGNYHIATGPAGTGRMPSAITPRQQRAPPAFRSGLSAQQSGATLDYLRLIQVAR